METEEDEQDTWKERVKTGYIVERLNDNMKRDLYRDSRCDH